MIVYDYAIVDGDEWLWVRDSFSQMGWIKRDALAWTPPQLLTGQKYVVLSEDRVWPKNKQYNRCAYYWPKDRRILVKEHNASYYETRYGGEIAYVEKDKCVASNEAVAYALDTRALYVVDGERGRSNSRYFDNAQGNWSEAFVESMLMSVGVSRTDLPCADDLDEAILFWLTAYSTQRFYFWNAEAKRAFKTKYPEELGRFTDDLTSYEQSLKPTVGKWIYFAHDAGG